MDVSLLCKSMFCISFDSQYILLCYFILSSDPHQRERYLKSNIYLAPLNGEIEHANSTGNFRRHGFCYPVFIRCSDDSFCLGCLCTFSSVALSCVVYCCSLAVWRDSFLRIQKLVLIGGQDDGVITPWESRSLQIFHHGILSI